jgi:hypothetical protein
MGETLTLDGLFASEMQTKNYIEQSIIMFRRLKFLGSRFDGFLQSNNPTREHNQISHMQNTCFLAMDILRKSCISLVKEEFYSPHLRGPHISRIERKMKDYDNTFLTPYRGLSHSALVIMYDKERRSMVRMLQTLGKNNPSVRPYIGKIIDLLAEQHDI